MRFHCFSGPLTFKSPCNCNKLICCYKVASQIIENRMRSDQMNTITARRNYILCATFIVLFLIFFWTLYSRRCPAKFEIFHNPYQNSESSNGRTFSVWPEYSNLPKQSHNWYTSNCFGEKFNELSIEDLYELVQVWGKSSNSYCRDLHRKFTFVYSITQRSGSLVIPDKFSNKVRKWLGNKEDLFQETKHQTITIITNELTQEGTVLNPLRAKRPISKPDVPDKEYVEKIAKESEGTCDFCQNTYKDFTAEDTFGRIENKNAFTAANTFKYDAWHALFITRTHHPLNWSEEQFMDVWDVAKQWFNKVHQLDNDYQFPTVFWDLLPKASASQIHPHIHGNVIKDKYYGAMENWRVAGEKYYRQFGTNFFTDITEMHNALGLAVTYGTAVAFANINAKKDTEVVIMGKTINEDFLKMLYFVVRAYIDDMELVCYSMGMALPRIGTNVLELSGKAGDIPVFARIAARGVANTIRNDISSLELYGSSNVNVDPFQLIQQIRNSVKKRG